MKYDDLLNIPFKKGGRDRTGYDCYGAVAECCRRAGTPLRDLYAEITELPAGRANDYISMGLNVRRINAPKVGGLVFIERHGTGHVGYIVERGKMLHATRNRGVIISPLIPAHVTAYYEVMNESDTVQETLERKNNS